MSKKNATIATVKNTRALAIAISDCLKVIKGLTSESLKFIIVSDKAKESNIVEFNVRYKKIIQIIFLPPYPEPYGSGVAFAD